MSQVVQEADREAAYEFVARVRERLRKGAKEYGNLAYLDRSLPEILREIAEEGADGPGWAVLGRHLVESAELSPAAQAHLEKMLLAISAKFFEAWQLALLALEFCEEEAGKP